VHPLIDKEIKIDIRYQVKN